MIDTCGYTVIDGEGNEGPCDRPATGWRWYQGHFHEDALDVACDEHANEGGRRIHDAEAQVSAVRELLDEWPSDDEGAPFRYALRLLLRDRQASAP